MTLSIDSNAILSAYDFNIVVGKLPADMILALAQHGFKQKLGDAAAMTKEEKADLGTEEAIAQRVTERRKAIVDNLLAGKFSAGGNAGPRLKGLDAIKHEVAVEALKAAFAAKGIKWPTGKGSAEQVRELVAKYQAKYGAQVDKEANRRAKLQADATEALEGII